MFTILTLPGSMYLLARASSVLPIGTAYGVWVSPVPQSIELYT